ncbi:unnamed protein product [Phytophthora lilii]|uniref:Unnamed protein product n=1 Tax=Phytophthora lilii TaxID=2077276 RepID=A0A9W7CWS2_9STRA|nr:unnamed protein product [Phytophthora lilii]
MASTTAYGSLSVEGKPQPRTTSCLGALKVAPPLALLIVLIMVLAMAMGSIVVSIVVPIIVIIYLLLFAAFCCIAWPFATSFVKVPYIALKFHFKLVSLLVEAAGRGFKPTFPEWTLAYELIISMMRYSFLDYGHIVADANAHRLRGPFQLHGKTILKSCCRKHNTVPEKLIANGMEHMWMRDPEKKQHRVVVIHYHGGGYCISDPLWSWPTRSTPC